MRIAFARITRSNVKLEWRSLIDLASSEIRSRRIATILAFARTNTRVIKSLDFRFSYVK